MAQKKSDEIKIHLDDEDIDNPILKNIEDSKIERLSHRITFITVMLPCLILIIIYLVYNDVTKKFVTINETGGSKLQSLSQDLENRILSLSDRYSKLEAYLSDKFPYFEKRITEVNDNFSSSIKQLENTLKDLKSNSVDKKELKDISDKITKIDGNIASTSKDINDQIKSLEQKLASESAKNTELIDAINKELVKAKAGLITLSSTALDKNTFSVALKNEQDFYQNKLNKVSDGIDERIIKLNNKIAELENKIKILESRKAFLVPNISDKPKKTPKTTPIKIEHGTIIEQEIIE
ncbi:MAG: hypothetical protein HQK76_13325 [Desulfobacterales bacterium]|nr:hypothetical protein [Desulfobacterales bacterium]